MEIDYYTTNFNRPTVVFNLEYLLHSALQIKILCAQFFVSLGKPEVPVNVTLAKGTLLKIESDIYGICLMKKSVDVKLCAASCYYYFTPACGKVSYKFMSVCSCVLS